METRFTFFSVAALMFAIVLMFGISVARAAGDMSQQSTSSGYLDRDKTAQDTMKSDHGWAPKSTDKDQSDSTYKTRSTQDKDQPSSMSGNESKKSMMKDEHSTKMDRDVTSWSEKNKGFTREQERELSSLTKHQRETFASLPRNERNEFFTLGKREREAFFTLKPGERVMFFSMKPEQRTVFIALHPRERAEIIALRPEERTRFFSLNEKERHHFFSAKPGERTRILSKTEPTFKSSRDTDILKDTDRPRNMKSDQSMSSETMRKSTMGSSEHDTGMSGKSTSSGTKSDMDKSYDKDLSGSYKDKSHSNQQPE